MFAIVISEKGGAERREVFERTEISVGRVQGNDLMLPKGNVSKRHARLIYRDGRFIVTDLNSTNGTYVNRRRISQATIVREGDRIYIGDFVLRIEVPEGQSQADEVGDQTGSGPVLARESAAAEPGSGATNFPAEGHEDASGASYPKVPGPPRVPSGPRPSGPDRDSHPSERQAGSMVDVSHADIDARAVAPSNEDRIDHQVSALRQAVALLVDKTLEAVGPSAVEGNVTDVGRGAVEQALSEQLERLRASGGLDASLDGARVLSDARAELLELGPLGPLLMDVSVASIALTRHDHLVAARGDRSVQSETAFSSPAAVLRIVRRLCHAAGAPHQDQETVVERRLRDGSRLCAITGAASATGPLLVIEKPRRAGGSVEDLVRRGTVSRAMATFLHHCVAARVNVLVVGPRDEGTASVASALVGVAAPACPVVALLDFDDLVSGNAPHAAWLSVADAPMDAARMLATAAHVPDVRVVAELARREVTAALVDATGEGLDGIIAVAHAPNVRRALGRLTADVVAGRGGASMAAAREWVASAFDVVVEVGRLRDGRHRVLRVAELAGTSPEEIRIADVFSFNVERTAAGGAVEGTFNASGSVPRIADEVSSRGFSLESSLFTRPPSH